MLYSSDEHGALSHGYSLICFTVLLPLGFVFSAISLYPIYSYFCDSALAEDLTAAVAAAASLLIVSAPSSPPPPPIPHRSSSARSLGTRQAVHPPAAEELASGRSPATPRPQAPPLRSSRRLPAPPHYRQPHTPHPSRISLHFGCFSQTIAFSEASHDRPADVVLCESRCMDSLQSNVIRLSGGGGGMYNLIHLFPASFKP